MTDSAVAFFRATDRRFFVTAFLAATLLLREAAVLFAVDRLIALLSSIRSETLTKATHTLDLNEQQHFSFAVRTSGRIPYARPRILATHHRSPTKRNRQS
jgi:hypothetical protein